jgi:hypothetical protein
MLPDDRCVGGRQAAELELYSMRRRLANVKSVVSLALALFVSPMNTHIATRMMRLEKQRLGFFE